MLSGLLSWMKRKPGKKILARWRVEPDLWRQFVASEGQRAEGPPYSELPPNGDAPPDGVEVVVEPYALWIGGRRVSLPLRGSPEVLSAALEETAHAPTTIELRLKYPAYARSSGGLQPARYTRLAVPVPRSSWRESKTVVAHFNRDVPSEPDFFHGRGDGSDAQDVSRCWSCGHETHKYRSECERCGASLQSRRWSRRFGLMMIPCGLIITGLMGTVLYRTLPMLLRPGVQIDGRAFNGSGATAALVLAVFIAVFAFGAGIVLYGAWQAATGRRSLRLASALVMLFGGLLTLATVVPWWLGR